MLAANVENLALSGAARRGTGNGSDNRITGSAAADTLEGLAGDDALNGGNGNDLLAGGDGKDILAGGASDDQLDGGFSNDILIGGIGTDLMEGGGGADTWVFNDGDTAADAGFADRIVDFSGYAGDKIDVRLIDADAGTAADDAFSFIGSSAFSGAAGELRFATVDGDTYLQGDVNGDGAADLVIQLDGLPPIVAADFIL